MTAPSLTGETLTCQDLDACLHPYLDGELESEDRADVEQHLLDCPRCRTEADAQRSYRKVVRHAGKALSARSPAAPDRLRQNIRATLAREEVAIRRRSWRSLLVWPTLAAAAAAGVVLLVRADAGRSRAATIVAAAIANHQRELPLEVTDSQLPQIQSWFKGKVDFPPTRIPQLRRVDLIGARLSHLSDREAAYVAYGTPTRRRVSLFVFDAPDLNVTGGHKVANHEVMLANQHGYNVALWKDREIAYSLVSDLDEKDILELVAASQR